MPLNFYRDVPSRNGDTKDTETLFLNKMRKRRRKIGVNDIDKITSTGSSISNTPQTSNSSKIRLKHTLKFPITRLSTLNFPLIFLILLTISFLPTINAIRCYCTDDHCVPAYGVCESSVCLVGLRRPDLTVIRTCGNEPLGCQRNLEHWVDLCACDQPFCNTFSYLRESTQNADSFPPPPPPLASNGHEVRHDLNGEDDGYGGTQRHPVMVDDDTRIFQRVDGPPGEIIDEYGVRRQAPLSTRTSLLSILFVIVPVSVGAAVIMVVSFNYYCHLC